MNEHRTEANKPVNKSDKSPATVSSLQQRAILNKPELVYSRGKKAPNGGKRLSGCTGQSDLPYCTELAGSQMLSLCSNRQVLGQPMLLWGILKGRC